MKKAPLRIRLFTTFTAGFGLAFGVSGTVLAQGPELAQPADPSGVSATTPDVPTAGGDEEIPATDFVRYVEHGDAESPGDGMDRLQTVVRSYRRGDRQVDLVSVVHIADSGYYDEMNERLSGYDVVLYEMVGGPVEKREVTAKSTESDPSMAGIRMAHALLQNLLGLEYQIEGIDYSGEKFVHADVDWREYSELMASRNQSMATLFQRAFAISLSGQEIPGVPSNDAESAAMLGGLMRALASGDPNDLKRIVAPMLSQAEALISLIEGDDGTVIITERNKVVMRGVAEQLAAGRRTIGVFYGAGHMPDLEERLLAQGFVESGVQWMDAWEIGGAEKAPAVRGDSTEDAGGKNGDGDQAGDPDAALINTLGFVGKLLQDRELMESVVDGIKALNSSGPAAAN